MVLRQPHKRALSLSKIKAKNKANHTAVERNLDLFDKLNNTIY